MQDDGADLAAPIPTSAPAPTVEEPDSPTTYPPILDLGDIKQAPLYGLQMAGPAWHATLGRQLARLAIENGCCRVTDTDQRDESDEHDDNMPGLLTNDDVTNDKTDKDETGDGPINDAPPDISTYAQARASMCDSDCNDVPDFVSSEDEAMTDFDDGDGKQPTAVD
eukprot:g71824.t1